MSHRVGLRSQQAKENPPCGWGTGNLSFPRKRESSRACPELAPGPRQVEPGCQRTQGSRGVVPCGSRGTSAKLERLRLQLLSLCFVDNLTSAGYASVHMGSFLGKVVRGVERRAAVLIVAGIAIALTSCDEQSIVEPRFYRDSALMPLPVCEDGVGFDCDTGAVVGSTALPTEFTTGACRRSNNSHWISFSLSMPAHAKGRWLLIGAGGETVRVLLNSDNIRPGFWRFRWCGQDDDGDDVGNGVYGVTFHMETGGHVYEKTRWFELE